MSQQPCGKCPICTCKPSLYNHDYIEPDPSPLAAEIASWLKSPSSFLDRLCAFEPGAKECKTYNP